jgi:hypothetical protein
MAFQAKFTANYEPIYDQGEQTMAWGKVYCELWTDIWSRGTNYGLRDFEIKVLKSIFGLGSEEWELLADIRTEYYYVDEIEEDKMIGVCSKNDQLGVFKGIFGDNI